MREFADGSTSVQPSAAIVGQHVKIVVTKSWFWLYHYRNLRKFLCLVFVKCPIISVGIDKKGSDVVVE